MASLTTDKNGNRNIRFADATGKRRSLYLGTTPQKTCEQIKGFVEKLVSASVSRCTPAPEVDRWVASLDSVMRRKLARLGLIAAVESVVLGQFVTEYIEGRNDAKPGTKRNWRQVRRHLLNYFDGSRSLQSVSKADAKGFRQYMIAEGFADNTIRKTCSVARQIYSDAIDRGLLSVNPFKQRDIPTTTMGSPDRAAYISVADAEAVLAACPDAEWRLIFALSRYAGLRCPSEHLALRWSDVHWDISKVTIRSPKTERYDGQSQRLIPIFSRLRPYLEAAFDTAPDGAEFVISRYRDTNANLRTQLLRIIGRSGVKPWPKLFHNLRSSCENDLMQDHRVKSVCSWIGHSVTIAHKHYLQVTESDFERASMPLAKSTPDSSGNLRPMAETIFARHEKTLEPSVLPSQSVPPAGFEPTTSGLGNQTRISETLVIFMI